MLKLAATPAVLRVLTLVVFAILATSSTALSARDHVMAPAQTCNTKGPAPGISDDSIKFGWFGPLSGPLRTAGQAVVDGDEFYFDQVNKAGGIKGRNIDLVALDDQYNPAVSQQVVRRLVEKEKIFALAGGAGTPNFVAVGPYLKQKHVVAIGPYAPSHDVGTLKFPTTYMTWTNFVHEFDVLTNYLVTKRKFKRFAMLYQTGDVGDDAITGATKALKAKGLKLIKKVSTEATTTNYSAIAQELKNTKAQVVLVMVQPTGAGQAIQAMHKIGFNPQIAGQSDLLDASFRDAFGKDVEGVIAATKTAGGGQWNTVKDPLVKKFVRDWKAAHGGKDPSSWNAVGYATAAVVTQALKTSPALTVPCLEYALQHMKNFKTGIMPPVTFGPKQRQGVLAAGVAQIKNGKLIELEPFTKVG